MATKLPHGLISFGPKANCTLELCKVEWGVLQYRPSITANALLIGLFGLSMLVHMAQGVRCRTWVFAGSIVVGCLDEILGYAARIKLNENPFSFSAFVMQIVCITTAPIFFCSAIYMLLSQSIVHLDKSLSRFPPCLFPRIFISCDILSLVLQAIGGALSALEAAREAESGPGNAITQAGLVIQVVTLGTFCALFVDYMVRFVRQSDRSPLSLQMKIFLGALFYSMLLILVRCAFRIDELSGGYTGEMIHQEDLFLVLESAHHLTPEARTMMSAVAYLHVAHPGLVFGKRMSKPGSQFSLSSNEVLDGGAREMAVVDIR